MKPKNLLFKLNFYQIIRILQPKMSNKRQKVYLRKQINFLKKGLETKKPLKKLSGFFMYLKKCYSISETLIVLTIPLSLIGIAARLIK